MKERLFVMNKMNEGCLNEAAISLAALKQSRKGDEVVVMTTDNEVGWFSVEQFAAVRGCKGGTTLVLKDLSNGDLTTVVLRGQLPEGIVRVRRVSAGVNDRTLRQIKSVPVVDTKPQLVVQPEGEFENILDVPLIEEGQEVDFKPIAPVTEIVEEQVVQNHENVLEVIG